ncbi:lambda phage CII family protein [Serratia ficaria]|uniref:lambda phage CII family protein n=1 Tax=Serratia ficaria TaxID=61651 RepID=UPI00218379A8|nr:lambda phage CII family protein [Serratia ficaria]CAI2535484.1 Bacteriophage CII protein [Serratia ficaria]
MESTTTARNEAREIQSDIMSRIAVIGVTRLASTIGVDKSQVSRWQSKGGLVEKASLLLAATGFKRSETMLTFRGEETAELARGLMEMLEHIRKPKTE